MKLREFLTVFEQSDRLRIVKNEKDVYTGVPGPHVARREHGSTYGRRG